MGGHHWVCWCECMCVFGICCLIKAQQLLTFEKSPVPWGGWPAWDAVAEPRRSWGSVSFLQERLTEPLPCARRSAGAEIPKGTKETQRPWS